MLYTEAIEVRLERIAAFSEEPSDQITRARMVRLAGSQQGCQAILITSRIKKVRTTIMHALNESKISGRAGLEKRIGKLKTINRAARLCPISFN